MSHISLSHFETQAAAASRRSPMARTFSAEQRARLSLAQKAYVANDPRWAEHRRKLAAAQEAKRMTLFGVLGCRVGRRNFTSSRPQNRA